MEDSFNGAALLKRLENLEYWKQLVFGISVCQRLLPNFKFFAIKNHVNGTSTLEDCLQKAWENIFLGLTLKDEINNAHLCESVAPSTEDFDTILVSSALDAAMSISLLMKAFVQKDTHLIVDIATLARDSVDMYVQDIDNLDSNDSDIEQKIFSHNLMQNELKQQRLDLEYLATLSNEIQLVTSEIKKRWFNKYESCLGLTL